MSASCFPSSSRVDAPDAVATAVRRSEGVYRIAAVGEILWDLLPTGKALGGAPANFAFHAHGLGAETMMISRIGMDEFGREILARFDEAGLSTAGLQLDEAAPTGTVSVELSAAGDPTFTIHEGVAWDRLEVTDEALTAMGRADVVCFGTLGQRSAAARHAVERLLDAALAAGARTIFDVNLRQAFYSRETVEESLRRACVVKLNETELPVLAEMLGLDEKGESEASRLGALAQRYELEAVALTRGGKGSLLWQAGEMAEHAGVATTVRDTIGAGDSFTAALAIGLCQGWELSVINERANRVAAFVCSQAGATPRLPEEVRAQFQTQTALTR